MKTRITAALAAILAVGAALALTGSASGAPTAPAGPTVTVSPQRTLATLHPGAVGVNTPLWNAGLTSPGVPQLIRNAGIQTLEFNGGGVSDLYHWQAGTEQADPDPAGHTDYSSIPPKFSFDQFEKVARDTGAHTFVHVNYGTGSPAEAAAWVAYAKAHGDHVGAWAIGEEVWGNGGIPGINFEPDAHQDKSPQAYATNALQFIAAMKKADPSAEVGVELTGEPGGPLRAWDDAVMQIVGSKADFVDIHVYPFGLTDTSDAAILALPRAIPATITALRQLLDRDASTRTQIVVGETNSAVTPTKQQIGQTNALYLADDMLSLLQAGAYSVDWWALQNGGYALYGGADLGLLSSGDCNDDGTLCAPPPDTPFRPYYALQLVGAMTMAGGAVVPASSTDARVVGHAVRGPAGTLAVLLQNDDPKATVSVHLFTSGYRQVVAVRYGQNDKTPHVVGDDTTLPPHSLTLVVLHS